MPAPAPQPADAPDGKIDAGDEAAPARHAPADQNGRVDRNRSGGRLRDGRHIEHLALVHPVQFIDEFLLHQRYDDEAAAEGEGADIEHVEKQSEQRFCASHFCVHWRFLQSNDSIA